MPYKDALQRQKARRRSYLVRKDRILRKEREYLARNPIAFRSRKLKHRYGITHEIYQAMFAAQGGLCALCQDRVAVDVDHCHDTGAVRGLLCRGCNVGLGQLGDSIAGIERAIAYLNKPPIQIPASD